MDFLIPFREKDKQENIQGISLSKAPPPLWLMRQAGRYLPEYRAIRANYPSFMEFCFSVNDAARVTLQPLERFDFDAAILFSDILVIPHALGQNVWFEAGEGPRLAPLDLGSLRPEAVISSLAPVCDAVSLIRSKLPTSKALIGFCGAPWTVATYMIQGRGSKDFGEAKKYAYQNPKDFQRLLDVLVEVSTAYLLAQIDAGVTVVQIFDSWAGAVPAQNYEAWVVEPTRRMVSALKASAPHIPLIGFPKGSGEKYATYAQKTGVDGLGLDSSVDLGWILQNVPEHVVLQGNLDPMILVSGGDALVNQVDYIKKTFGNRPYIFNLGHGIVPETPISHVDDLVRLVRQS